MDSQGCPKSKTGVPVAPEIVPDKELQWLPPKCSNISGLVHIGKHARQGCHHCVTDLSVTKMSI